jgi:hypothetical protein
VIIFSIDRKYVADAGRRPGEERLFEAFDHNLPRELKVGKFFLFFPAITL